MDIEEAIKIIHPESGMIVSDLIAKYGGNAAMAVKTACMMACEAMSIQNPEKLERSGGLYKCPVCGSTTPIATNYCPECGQKVRI